MAPGAVLEDLSRPANAAAGSTINVVTPGGQVTCTVPAGVQPGMAFFIQVPAAAPPDDAGRDQEAQGA